MALGNLGRVAVCGAILAVAMAGALGALRLALAPGKFEYRQARPQGRCLPHDAADNAGADGTFVDADGLPTQWGRREASDAVEAFPFSVPDSVLADLDAQLAIARIPDPQHSHYDGLAGGVDLAYLGDLVRYWRDEYDWRTHEARLNENMPQYATTICGLRVAFVHLPASPEAAASSDNPRDHVPLLLLHGWPGSIVEFETLSQKLQSADSPTRNLTFDLVIPSMPGYAFSDAPAHAGFDFMEVARVYAELMARLGYDRYFVQGGDWGGLVGSALAQYDEEHVVGLHINFCPLPPPFVYGSLVDTLFLTPEDAAMVTPLSAMVRKGFADTGYLHQQATKPKTVGVALHSSPVAAAAWITEKFFEWADTRAADLHPASASPSARYDAVFGKDLLLTNVMMYWAPPGALFSSTDLYAASLGGGSNVLPSFLSAVRVPSAFADFPFDALRTPEKFIRQRYTDLRQYTRMPRGGHFGALEAPDLLVDDVTRFIRGVLDGNRT